jgi:hypothetical protein
MREPLRVQVRDFSKAEMAIQAGKLETPIWGG